MTTLRRDAVSSARWSAVSVLGRRALSLLTGVVLARLLPPSAFGLLAMAIAVIAFLEVFKDIGLGSAIVRWNALTHRATSTVFWLTTAFGAGMGLALAAGAPLIAHFYHEPRLTPLVQFLAISFPLSGSSIVPLALLTREMRFRDLTLVEVASLVSSTAVAIVMAASGFGVWSLAAQAVVASAASFFMLLAVGRWRPLLAFSFREVRDMVRYSLPLAGFNAVNLVARNVDNLLVGRYLGSQALGLYDLAYRLMLLPLQLISWVANRVALPAYSRVHNDSEHIRPMFLKQASLVAFLTFPMMLGLAACASEFVTVVFGNQWLGATTVLVILAPVGALQSVGTMSGTILLAVGRTDVLLRWGAFASFVVTVACLVGLQWGIVGVAAGYAVAIAALEYPKCRIVFALVGLSIGDLVRVLGRPLFCSLGMVLGVLATRRLALGGGSAAWRLTAMVAVGALVYGLLSWQFNRAVAAELAGAVAGAGAPERAPARDTDPRRPS